MFYYIHFVRPPPLQCLPSQPIMISISIMNDLRTESLKGERDVYYGWVKTSKESTRANALGPMTSPSKLTTWTELNAYKELLVFPPKDAREGDYWQLLLCTKSLDANRYLASVDMSGDTFGVHPFPVLSMPVHFTFRDQENTSAGRVQKTMSNTKQVQNERILKLPPLWNTPVNPLRILEHTSYDLDKKVWDSGMGLSFWLTASMTGPSEAPEVLSALINSPSVKVLELGAGTGLVSIVLSILLSHLPSKPQASVYATDLYEASAMEILNENIKSSSSALSDRLRLEPFVLDWNDEALPAHSTEGGFDMIVMADVTYNTASFPSLINTIARLSKRSPKPPIVLLAYKERDPDERKLWDMALGIGLQFTEVTTLDGAGGQPIEIYAGKFVENK